MVGATGIHTKKNRKSNFKDKDKDMKDKSSVDKIYLYPDYTDEEHSIWEKLYTLQYPNLVKYAHEDCLSCLDKLNLTQKTIPNLNLVSDYLNRISGWKIKPVNEMVSFDHYFYLLSQKYFPSTYYIRGKHEFEISERPDIFHELIGHVSMLLNKSYADFMHRMGLYGIQCLPAYKPYLLRLAWYTTEVGLIRATHGIKIYGASILSSLKEICYAIENEQITKYDFSLLDILRMPYEYDSLQRYYFINKNFEELYSIFANFSELTNCIEEARRLGSYELKLKKEELSI